MDLHDAVDDLAAMIESARSMPMSSSCLINRGEALALVNQIRDMLPAELRDAELVLREREILVNEGRREAERILAAAHDERARLLARVESELYPPADYAPGPPSAEYVGPDRRARDYHGAAAYHEGAHAGAQQEAETIRREAAEYVDHQLANLEMILNRALASIQRGRDRLHGFGDDFGPPGNLR